ncbi:hypothetical protein F2Q68_00034107 [Brassica cretica]|uniref:Uncharacterized protein n=1 Tax=Brassica cretica TaxID=69181 RepID=A0A8S9H211_BRACR|nr:hypothetical protein F2Q68_00034107 [Brassica cretica]
MPSELLKTCYAERNPSTLYVKGVQFFFSFRLKEEGLSLMKHAADARYERALIGKLVRSVKWGWSLWHSDEFRQHRALFISAYLPSFYSCQCVNLVERQCLCLWHIDVTKDDNMCDRCFWIKEMGMF